MPMLRPELFPLAGECPVTNLTQEIGLKMPLNSLLLMTAVSAVRTSILPEPDIIPAVSCAESD